MIGAILAALGAAVAVTGAVAACRANRTIQRSENLSRRMEAWDRLGLGQAMAVSGLLSSIIGFVTAVLGH